MKQVSTDKHFIKIQVLIQNYLEFDEQILYMVKQKRNLFTIWPEYIVATTNRLFFCIPTGFGSELNISNYPLNYIEKATLKTKISSSVLRVYLHNNGLIKTNYLPISKTKELYNYIIEKSSKES